MRLECFAASRPQQGRAEKDNEDAFLISLEDPAFAALCDGVGNPHRVAKKVLQAFQKLCRASTQHHIADPSTWTAWVRALDSGIEKEYFSTFAAVVILDTVAVGACAGNSRVFLVTREGDCRHITQGADRNTLGSGKAVPFPIRQPLQLGDTLLLLTDGAWAPLSLDLMKQIVSAEAPRHFFDVPKACLEVAARNGRTDDMTAIALRLVR
ncbi:MAG TPA: PP2C family serine/threonine-protein phosphatase [Candidatus Acidoferrales bacterium]|nr:PP2C family serine/threonine-protein phosphatase [Candidatus Acidoferrales bacterium]